MLSLLCEQLVRSGRTVSVIGRDMRKLERLVERANGQGQLIPVAVDYRDASALGSSLHRMANDSGPPVRTICWVHDEIAPGAVLQISNYVRGTFWHVLGSSAGDPTRPEILASWRERFGTNSKALDYRQIILGFVPQAGECRWLTNVEISHGVERAIKGDEPLTIVGTVAPWSEKPQ